MLSMLEIKHSQNLETAKAIRDQYRKKFPTIAAMWKDLNKEIKMANKVKKIMSVSQVIEELRPTHDRLLEQEREMMKNVEKVAAEINIIRDKRTRLANALSSMGEYIRKEENNG